MTYDKSGKWNPFYGRKHTPEAKARMAAARSGKRLPPRSEETKLKIKLSNLRTKAATSGIDVSRVSDSELETFVRQERLRLEQAERAAKPPVWTPERRAGVAERMKRSWQDPVCRARMIDTRPIFSHTPETKAKIAAANHKRKGIFKHSEATKAKISASSNWKARKGDFSYQHFFVSVKARLKTGQSSLGVRSLWEKRAAMLLDEDSSVACFQYESLGVPYLWKEKKRHTLPDFLATMADNSTVMIEVKPRGYTYNEKERAKAATCSAYCAALGWKYEVWDERRLWPGLSQSEVRAAVKLLT
jgi:hypothetical protein